MDLISKSDTFLIKATLASLVLLVARRFLQYLQQLHVPKKQPPIISTKGSKSQHHTPTRSIKKALARSDKDCVVFYGSQTGTAEQYAHQFAKESLRKYKLRCLVADLDQYDYDDLKTLPALKPVVFIVATFGEGEPTDNAVGFHEFLQSKLQAGPPLENLNYAVFGLGSTTYRHYNAMAKTVDSFFTARRASRLGTLGLGNDGAGTLEDDFMAWKDQTLAEIAVRLDLEQIQTAYEPSYLIEELSAPCENQIFLGEFNKAQLKGKVRGPFTAQNPFPAQIIESRDLFSAVSPRRCVHLEIDISNSTIEYETGDHLAVWPLSAEREVERFLRVFGLAGKRDSSIRVASKDPTLAVPLPGDTTYEIAVRHYLDICAPVSRFFLATLASFADDPSASAELLRLSEDKDLHQQLVKSKSLNISQLLEVLRPEKTWSAIPFAVIVEGLGRVKPRFYSISSSSLVSRKKISITAVMEAHQHEGSPLRFEGLATSYLQALHTTRKSPICEATARTSAELGTGGWIRAEQTHVLTGSRGILPKAGVMIHVRKSKFRLPKDHSVPVIMIGPGTGVAPFRAFVQERAMMSTLGKRVGKTLLFYGCRRADEDFLYRDEWKVSLVDMDLVLEYCANHFPAIQELEAAFAPGEFSMHVAFSRQDPNRKCYVQNLLADQAEEIQDLVMNKRAKIYICGDAARMAKDVFKTITNIIAEDSSYQGDHVRAEEFLLQLKAQDRWLEDVW
jgi:NADPH-ferrihemoprotein reductase